MPQSGLAEAVDRYSRLSKSLDALPNTTERAVSSAGRIEFDRFAVEKWGSDRKFSGSARSAKGKGRAAVSVNAQEQGARIVFTPTGSPWYITFRGRDGGKKILPRKRSGKHAVLTPGGPRAWSTVGRLPAKSTLVVPLVPRVERVGVAATHKQWVGVLEKAF